MNSVSWLFEFGATFVENTVILATVTCASIRKRQTKHHLLFLFLLSVFTSLLVDAMNRISVFSYVTPIVSMTFVILISSRILSCGTLVIRSLSTILSYLIIQCIDYIVLILFGHLTGSSADFFTTFVTTVGVNRTLFITIDKLIDIIIYFLFRGFLPRISNLTPRLRIYLLILLSVSYVAMQCLFQVVLVPDLPLMQLAVVASWCFLIGFVIAFIAFFLSLTKQEQDRQRMEMLRSENELMADNYKTLHNTQQEYARKLHDFKYHVRTVHELISGGKVKSALEYTDSLLKTSYHQAAQCHSGNDIVDAIINSKLAEA